MVVIDEKKCIGCGLCAADCIAQNIVIEENGKLGEIDQNGDIIGESDSFLETTKENFKNSIKLEIKYCQNSKCNTEKLQLTYVD